MAFVPIDANKIKVGDPITKDILDLIKLNFDDHESRINSLATTGGTVYILNGDVSLRNFNISSPGIFYYKARQDFSINDFRVQLFTKQGITTGSLSFDLQKANNTNPANFVTILNSELSFNFGTELDYSEKIASINSSLNGILTGEVLRISITDKPFNFNGDVLISIGAQ